MESEIKLLSHASLLISVDNKKILTDPWFFGTAFNDGWELSHKPNLDEIQASISEIDIIWISHEHPDHLHFPTLKWIAKFVKNDVEIFFQKNNSVKVFEALKKIGFTKFKTMSHLKKIRVSKNVYLACYAHRHLDSSLAIFVDKKFWLLNINDTELNRADINIIKDKFGSPSVLYNQFSIAGSDGIKLNLANEAKSVLEKMVEHHKLLGANMTVPFASFVRFARKDNQYMNEFVNSVYDVKEKFSQNNIKLIIQAIGGDSIKWTDVTKSASNEMMIDEQGKKYFSTVMDEIEDNHDYYIVEEEELKKTIEERVFEWRRVTSKFVLHILKLKPIRFKITDWNEEVWQVDFLSGPYKNYKRVTLISQ